MWKTKTSKKMDISQYFGDILTHFKVTVGVHADEVAELFNFFLSE